MKRLLTAILLLASLLVVFGCGTDNFSPEHRKTDPLFYADDQNEDTKSEEFSMESQGIFPDAANVDSTQETQLVKTAKEAVTLATEAVVTMEQRETEIVTTTILPTTEQSQVTTTKKPSAASRSVSTKASVTTAKATSQAASRVETDKDYPYMCSRNSKVFHKTACFYGIQIKEENRVYFETREEAVQAGLSPCSRCSP